jgi:hypothetical protein
VQVTQADSVCVEEPDVFLQRAEGPVAELNDEPETFRLKQVTGGGTVRPGKTPRAAHHRKAHVVHMHIVFDARAGAQCTLYREAI